MAAKRPRSATKAIAPRKPSGRPLVPGWAKWTGGVVLIPLSVGIATNLLSVPFQNLFLPEAPAPDVATTTPAEELRRIVVLADREGCPDLLGNLDALAADDGFVATYRKLRAYSPDKGFALVSSISSLPLGSELRSRAERCQQYAAYALSRTSYDNPLFP